MTARRPPSPSRAIAHAIAHHSADRLAALLGRLNARAEWAVGKSPAHALKVATIAVVLARAARLRKRAPAAVLLELEGDACREAAVAQTWRAAFGPAEWWARRGLRLYRAAAGDLRHQETRLELVLSFIIFSRGRADEAREMLARVAQTFRDTFDDTAGYVKAQSYYTAMLIEEKRFDEALAVLDEVIQMGPQRIGAPTYACLMQQLSLGCVEKGDRHADFCYGEAIRVLRELRMENELRKTRLFHADLLRARQRLDEALAEYDQIAGEFVEAGDDSYAACVAIPAVEILLEQGRTREARQRSEAMLGALESARADRDASRVRELLAQCGA